MAFSNKQDDDDDIMAEINMTPLIDIMLVLLIIFMVTSSVSLESGLDIDLPKTSSQTKTQESLSVIVSIDRQGGVSIQGQAVTKETLVATLAQALEQAGTRTVVLEGDQLSTLGSTIEIMDLAKQAGAEKFAIAADSQN